MTGFIDRGGNPVSRLTIASLEDIGYQVDYAAAEHYFLPTMIHLAEMGTGIAMRGRDHGGYGMMFFPDQEVLPEDVLC